MVRAKLDGRLGADQGEGREAFASTAVPMLDALKVTIARRTGCREEAADIVQESWLRLTERDTTEVANPRGYLGRIARNLMIDRRRKPAVQGEALALDDTVVCPLPTAERILLGRDRLRHVLECADRLPPKCKEVFVLRKIEGLEQHEIAERLGISLNMVQKHLRKALADIAAALEADS